MALKDIIGEYAFVAKVDVSDIDKSAAWYGGKLGLVHDPRFDTPTWRQYNVPGLARAAIGLNLNPGGVGSGGAVSTFVVANIQLARKGLIEHGVEVGPVMDVGHGVLLAFFKDPDGNSLGLRQNSAQHPAVAEVGKA
ncbi:VOC family protein [Chromobacterium vaccinii]|uniref:VOC family protein n=1 Tax=Chromobacterium vaccinii TaxID=1108595 RepID=A0ABV0FDL0_9NEIS